MRRFLNLISLGFRFFCLFLIRWVEINITLNESLYKLFVSAVFFLVWFKLWLQIFGEWLAKTLHQTKEIVISRSFNIWTLLANCLTINYWAVDFVMVELTQLLSQVFPEFLLILPDFICWFLDFISLYFRLLLLFLIHWWEKNVIFYERLYELLICGIFSKDNLNCFLIHEYI